MEVVFSQALVSSNTGATVQRSLWFKCHKYKNMKKAYFALMLLITTTCFSQTGRKLTTFASLQFNKTLYDQKPFHKTGIGGIGLQNIFKL
jgi:hypothetical protein